MRIKLIAWLIDFSIFAGENLPSGTGRSSSSGHSWAHLPYLEHALNPENAENDPIWLHIFVSPSNFGFRFHISELGLVTIDNIPQKINMSLKNDGRTIFLLFCSLFRGHA